MCRRELLKKGIVISAALALALALGLMLAGCGGSGDTESTEADANAGTEAAEEESAGMPNPWQDAQSAAEAAVGAGLDEFIIDEDMEISLGKVEPTVYRYMEGMAEAEVPIAAVEMTIRKGLSELAIDDVAENDISGDYTEYKYDWTQEIDGTKVTCYGNRSGEATKTIWKAGEYCYAILAFGAGGDDDYGLPAEDVETLVKGIR